MDGAKLGNRCGLWATADEISAGMFHVTDKGEFPITADQIWEGMVVRDVDLCSLVFEVFLEDPIGDRFFLTEL